MNSLFFVFTDVFFTFSMAVLNKMIYFKFGNYSFASVLIDGQFPNYQRVIPEAQDKKFQINRRDLFDALCRVGFLVEQKSRRVYFDLLEGMLTITAQESKIGTATQIGRASCRERCRSRWSPYH